MRRACFVVLVIGSLVAVPVTVAFADHKSSHDPPGQQKKADKPDRSGKPKKSQGGGSGGTGTPDSGDNKHPSGKDRSVEPGGSYPQGFAQSDPDGMSNGGADKPGGTGGIDQDDQDGNNGCGNDDDFEDDNNGLCLGLKKKAATSEPASEEVKAVLNQPAPENTPFDSTGNIGQLLVLPEFAQPAPAGASEPVEGYVGVLEAAQNTGARVLSAMADAGSGALATTAGVLPTTGAGIASLVGLGLALVGTGATANRYAARREPTDHGEPVEDVDPERELISV